MADNPVFIRGKDLEQVLKEADGELTAYLKVVRTPAIKQLPLFYRFRDMLISQGVYLSAMLDYAKSGAGSRGSALYTDAAGKKPDVRLPDLYKCGIDGDAHVGIVQDQGC